MNDEVLKNCRCGGIANIQSDCGSTTSLYQVYCEKCSNRTKWLSRNDAIIEWNYYVFKGSVTNNRSETVVKDYIDEINLKLGKKLFVYEYSPLYDSVIITYTLNPSYSVTINPELLHYDHTHEIIKDLINTLLKNVVKGIKEQSKLFEDFLDNNIKPCEGCNQVPTIKCLKNRLETGNC